VSGARTRVVFLDAGTLPRGLACVAAAGTDNVDLASARTLGITVRNVPDYGRDSVAEHAIAMLFALRRGVSTYCAAARDRRWGRSPLFCWTGPRIRDIGGSLFGVVGRGRIGESVARLVELVETHAAERRALTTTPLETP
jgi:glycerate dehydrogenase